MADAVKPEPDDVAACGVRIVINAVMCECELPINHDEDGLSHFDKEMGYSWTEQSPKGAP